MSLDNVTVAEAPTAGQETATATDASTQNESQFEGILDIDNQEPAMADTPEEGDLGQPEDGDAEDGQQPDPWDGYEDFQTDDGEIFKIPSKLKDGYLRQADYTRKTQAVAEQAKQLQARETALSQRYEQSEQEFEAKVALSNITAQLKQFEGRNWNAEAAKLADDPIGFQELQREHMRFQELRDYHKQFSEHVNYAAQQRTEAAQQETVKRLQETKAYAEKHIKGWTPDLDLKLTDWAEQELGFDRNTLIGAYTPQVYRTLYGAFQWEQSLKRQQTAKPPPTTPPVTPTKTVTAKGNAVVQKDPGEMSEAEFVAYREAQIARRKR
jgi:hypothetical protein